MSNVKLTRNDIQLKLPNWAECLGGYTESEGQVTIRCKKCGDVFTRSIISIRHNAITCRNCANKSETTKIKQFRLKQINKAMKLTAMVIDAKTKPRRMVEAAQARERRKHKKELKRINTATQIELRACKQCGRIFVGNQFNKQYCSSACERMVHDRNRTYNMLVVDADITLDKLYDRDGGRCQLCGQMCNWNDYVIRDGIKIVGNMYPSKDHIIPISKGGVESWNNVQLAHRGCNSSKGNRLIKHF